MTTRHYMTNLNPNAIARREKDHLAVIERGYLTRGRPIGHGAIPRCEPSPDGLKECRSKRHEGERWLPVCCFHRRNTSPDFHSSECKVCVKKRRDQNRKRSNNGTTKRQQEQANREESSTNTLADQKSEEVSWKATG